MTLTVDASEVRGRTTALSQKLIKCALVVLLAMTVSVFICFQTNPMQRRILFGPLKIKPINNFRNVPRSSGRDIEYTRRNNSSKFRNISDDEDGRNLTCEPRTLQILFWHRDLGSPGSIDLPCGGRCLVTTDVSRYDSSDAVVFQGDSMSLESFPRNRSRHQKWVYRSMEPPTNVFPYSTKLVRLRRQRDLYNLTSTYESTSDIATPYFDGSCSIDRRETAKTNETEVDHGLYMSVPSFAH